MSVAIEARDSGDVMTQQRKVGYALTMDGYHVAYAMFGQGEICHVFIPEFVSSVDEVQWQHPALMRVQRHHASLGRCINVDTRGIGLSDFAPLDTCFSPVARATDILAVLDALEIERVVITGEGYSGHAAAQFAASYPERTIRLALNNSYACQGRFEGGEIVPYSTEEIAEIGRLFGREWGTGRMTSVAAPGLASDSYFLDYVAARERRTASPATAAAYGRASAASDIRHLLSRIVVPTLVYYTGDLTHLSVEHSSYLAAHIPGAILVEAPGGSFYVPEATERQNAWAEFILGGPAALSTDSRLLTLLFTDIVNSTKLAAEVGDARWTSIVGDFDAYVAQRVESHGGRVVKQTGDGHLIVFDLPRRALRAAREIADGVHVLGVEVRCGLHTGEVEVLPDGDLRGIAVHVAARVCAAAAAREVLASRTVAELAAGSDFRFEDRGTQELKGIAGSWTLYRVLN